MAFGTSLAEPYFGGTATSEEERYEVALGGHGYIIDGKYLDLWGAAPLDMIRQQGDTADQPSEATLNPNGPWRRSQDDWRHGAGQEWLDKPTSDRARYFTSKGIDPWTRYGLSLLPSTALSESSADTNLFLAVSGGRLYMSEGQTIRVTGVGNEVWGDATGEPAVAVSALATDGATVYAGFGASGIYKATGTVFASYATGTVGLVRYAKGRLLAANGAALHNPIAAGAIPAAFFTHPNTSWAWTDAAEGPSHIYLSGYAGDKSMIYKTAVKPDGTALDIPTVAFTLPDGELAYSVTGYGGFVTIGTSNGVRFAFPDGDGNLRVGPYTPTPASVLCAEGQGQYVWFGFTNYDGVSTGLGRLDPTVFTAELVPAYASDLMATVQGAVQAVATYLDKRFFTVSGSGVWSQQTAKVTSGTMVSGKVTFGLPDRKTALTLDVRHDPLPDTAEVEMWLAADAADPELAGTSELDGSAVSSPDAFVLNQRRGSFFEWTAIITGDMTLRRITLRADPSSERTILHTVPILLSDTAVLDGVHLDIDVAAEYDYLVGLLHSREVVNYQAATVAWRVVMEDFDWKPRRVRTQDRARFQGTFIAKVKEV